jgi:copper chaperone CopZ
MALVQQFMKEEVSMENVLFDVPTMYADHHVIAVRQALLAVSGVEDVWASSAWKQVKVSFDPSNISPEGVSQVLEEAGYAVNNGELPKAPSALPNAKDPAWDTLGARSTKTHAADLAIKR